MFVSSSHRQKHVHRQLCRCILQIFHGTGLHFNQKFLCITLSFVCQISYFLYIFRKCIYTFFLVKGGCLEQPSSFGLTGKCVSACIVSPKGADHTPP